VPLAEGTYKANLTVRYRNGYASTASSPDFTLDVTAPKAEARVDDSEAAPGQTPVFSPNKDGSKDELIIVQSGSDELSWVGEIRKADASPGTPAVRSVRFTGTPPSPIRWDGMDDKGALAPDGTYAYQLFATDQAGNTGRSASVRFELFTKDTPVMLTTDLRAFSPNGDGVRDTINLQPQIQETSGIASWKITVQNIDSGIGRPASTSASTIRTITGTTGVPATVSWNGRTDGGQTAPDGSYVARLDIEYRSGNKPSALSRAFRLDTSSPEASASLPFTVFSPNGDGNRDYLPINVETEGDDEWNAAITDGANKLVRSWNWTGRTPQSPLAWDGTDQVGNSLPDGDYTFTLSSTDEAGNSTRKTISGITLDARVPRAFFTSSAQAAAPRAGSADKAVKFSLMLTPQEGVDYWKLELVNQDEKAIRTFSGEGSAPPESVAWNGDDDSGTIHEGTYTPQLFVYYTKGDIVEASTPQVVIDTSGPALTFTSTPQYFSPDNDGVDDELFIALTAEDVSPIAKWTLSVNETQGTKQLFWQISGRGSPSGRITWDGRSNQRRLSGELVQSATDYSYTYTAEDALGNASTITGTITTDVLVMREGDVLKIQVPSITFRADHADFEGLPPERAATNTWVLSRIAQILGRFKDYKITVEGHANPVTPAGTKQREQEETEGYYGSPASQPLSLARAQAVIDLLVQNGISRSRMTAVGRGGTQTVADWQDEGNRWKNRRVEFILNK
jgi:outer membrane protein OmpA-like peptidoglycan-associated protein/flagellar hook assembly protein FlgD